MNQIKAILFDMDGVLIDAKEWHFMAFNRALKLFGLDLNHQEHILKYDGLPTKDKLELLTLEKDLPKSLHSFINEIKQIYTLDEIYAKCKPFYAHEFALSRLKNEGFFLGVCTNSVRKTMEVALEKAMIIQFFDILFSNQDVEKSKPNPEIYNKCMKKLCVSPLQTLILEDNEHGINAAIASGAHLLKIKSINDVNYETIKKKIEEINKQI